MKENLFSNPKYMAIAIRYQFFKGIPKKEAYKIIYKIVGDNAISYKDFDFWWFRFSNGNYDLNAEPPKTRDFIDFPDNVLDKIVGKLSYGSRCRFRKTSKKYREAVDNNIFIIKKVRFTSHPNEIQLQIDEEDFVYCNKTHEIFKRCTRNVTRTENFIPIRSKAYVKLAMKELSFAVGRPNHRIKKLSMVKPREIMKNNKQKLQLLSRKIQVEHFNFEFYCPYEGEGYFDEDEMEGQNEVLKMIKYLEPGTLKHIELCCPSDYLRINTNMIAKTKQWKRARQLTTDWSVNVEVEDLANFKNIYLSSPEEEKLMELKNVFQNSPKFKFCCIETWSKERLILNELKADSFPIIDGSIQIDLIGRIDSYITFKKIN